MEKCPCCSQKLRKDHNFCPSCGAVIPTDDLTVADVEIKKSYSVKTMVFVALLTAIVTLGVYIIFSNYSWEQISSYRFFPSFNAFSDNPVAITEASQSVVKLHCYDEYGQLCTTGSGFACFADNVIVTNYHVIESDVASIEMHTESGAVFDITHVLATDPEEDIAIISTKSSHNLTLLQLANSDELQKGEKVVAIGSPLGLLNSVSTGVFSGYVMENNMDVLQFTASISSGSSGGALFNDSGEVLGITFASYEDGQNLNLAVPINHVEDLWNSIDLSSKLTVREFYNTFPHSYPVDQVIANAEEWNRQQIIVEGYVSHISTTGIRDVYEQSIDLVSNEADIIGNITGSDAVADQRFNHKSIVVQFSQPPNNQYNIGDYVVVSGKFSIWEFEKSEIHRGGSMYVLSAD